MNVSNLIFVGPEGYVKVGAHRTDASKLVLKSIDPANSASLAQAFGLTPGKTWQGSKYWIMEIPKAGFIAGMTAMGQALQAPEVKALAPLTCPQCGGTDGGHWASCSLHPEQAN